MHAFFFSHVNVNALTPKPKYPREIQDRSGTHDCYICGERIGRLMYVRLDGPGLRAHSYKCKLPKN